MNDFFISYNGRDRDWAEWLAWTLEEEGFTVVIQAWDFVGGESFIDQMNEALLNTRKFVAVMSRNYFTARFTMAELNAALERDPTGSERTLLPFLVEEVNLPPLLRSIVYTSLIGLAEVDARAAVVKAARASRGKPSSPPKFPGDPSRVAKTAKIYPGPQAVGVDVGPPALGYIIAKSCNRKQQEATFKATFHGGVRKRRGYPQMYVVHGPPREQHASLVERLREGLVAKYAASLAGGDKPVRPHFWEQEQDEWPSTDSLPKNMERLLEWLIVQRIEDERLYQNMEFTAESFRRLLPPLNDRDVVVVQHRIEAEEWTPQMSALVKEYLNFWDELKAGGDIPQFLIFLNVLYQPRQSGFRRKIRDAVERLSLTRRGRGRTGLANITGRDVDEVCESIYCIFKPLQELPRVGLKDVEQWFEKYKLGRNRVAWETQSKNIFRTNKWDFDEEKDMADVEAALEEFVDALATGGRSWRGERTNR